MIKGFLNKYIKAALNELFTDATKDSIHTSFGADLFSDSNIHLKNLTIRADLFDAHLYPLKLISGHLGDLSIEGIAELALGGKIRINVENVFLLFKVEEVIDPEYIQYLKKIIIEIHSNMIQHTIIRELLKRIQGFTSLNNNSNTNKEPDFKKQRLLILQMVNYFFKSFTINMSGIHIRIETPTTGNDILTLTIYYGHHTTMMYIVYTHSILVLYHTNLLHYTIGNKANPNYCSALGVTIPTLKLSPKAATVRPDGIGKVY